MAYTKKYNGSAWIDAPIKKWNGSNWIDAYTYKYNGSAWIQLWPNTAVNARKQIDSSGMNTYRSGWDNAGVAKQGVYSSYAAAHGFMGCNCTVVPGYGNITSINGNSNIGGVRDGSGSYGGNQTIRFFRSEVNSTSQNPNGKLSGEFLSSTGGPGSGGTISRPVSYNNNMRDWLNGVGSKYQLFMYSSSSSEYLGIRSWFAINFDYTYTAKSLVFETKDNTPLKMTRDMYIKEMGKEPYHAMTIYNEEQDMTLEEIIKRREDDIVEEIPYNNVIQAPILLPWGREREVIVRKDKGIKPTLFARIEILDMRMEDIPEYSLDNNKWLHLKSESKISEYVYSELPSDFNKYKDIVHIRVRDTKTDTIVYDTQIEPKIFIPDANSNGIILPGTELDLKSILKY